LNFLCTQAPIPLAFLFFKKKKVTKLTQETVYLKKATPTSNHPLLTSTEAHFLINRK
jgi:hypothetical protein